MKLTEKRASSKHVNIIYVHNACDCTIGVTSIHFPMHLVNHVWYGTVRISAFSPRTKNGNLKSTMVKQDSMMVKNASTMVKGHRIVALQHRTINIILSPSYSRASTSYCRALPTYCRPSPSICSFSECYGPNGTYGDVNILNNLTEILLNYII